MWSSGWFYQNSLRRPDYEISRLEGIIPALESAHAVAYAIKLAQEKPQQSILVNLSGRGDKDIDFVVDTYGLPENRKDI